MLYISICLTLLTIVAAVNLLLKIQKEQVPSLYKWLTYFVILVALLILVCQISRGAMKMMCHGNNEGCNQKEMGYGNRHRMHMQMMGGNCEGMKNCEMIDGKCIMKDGKEMKKECCEEEDDDEGEMHHDSSSMKMHH